MWKNIANNNIISLFCGVGGIDYPFVREGFTISFANDFNSDAVKIYNSNFKDKAILGDITKIAIDLLPNANGVIAGFPCQAFSIAGNRRGFNDTRGTLFFNVLKILDNKKPEFFLLENVKNLVSHDNGNTFRIIIESLQGIGYFVKYKVLNTCEYGNIPQNRERIYIVGFKNKMNAQKFNFPNPIELNKKISDIIDFKNKVPDKYYYTEIRYPRIYAELSKFNLKKDTVYQWRRHYIRENKSKLCPTLTANMGTGGHNVPIVNTKFGFRKLTPTECFLLQGFDNNFKIPKLSDASLYTRAGNSVSVTVIARIAEKIIEALQNKIEIRS